MTTLTTNAMHIGDLTYGISWYQLPRDEQFVVQSIIQRSQKLFELKGLGVIVCSLETYLRVISLPDLLIL